MSKKLTAEQRLDRAAVALMRHDSFIGYSGVIMTGNVRVEDDPKKCPTAYTDGYNVVYGRKFIEEELSEFEVRFVVLHENLHKMFMHTAVWQHLFRQNPRLTNIAADYVVNGTIKEAMDSGAANEVHMPAICQQLYDKDLSHGKDVGEVYRLLLNNPEKYGMQGCSGNCTPADGEGGEGGGQCTCPGPDSMDQHGFEEAKALTADEKRARAQEIDNAIRQGAILKSRNGSGGDRLLDELMAVKVDYRPILRQFLTDACQGDGELTYQRPNRRFLQHDLIMPTEQMETLPHILFCVDTSGSIGGPDLTEFVSNLAAAVRTVNPEKITLLYWDTAVCAVERYEQGELDKLIATTKPAGGGGTSPQCVSDWIRDNNEDPTCVIFLSDGYVCGWPTGISAPTIWCMNTDVMAPAGSITVRI